MPKLPSMVQYWLRSARDDQRAGNTLLDSGHLRLAMFCCHLAIEKGLKAILQSQTGRLPPRLHDLERLLERTGRQPPKHLARLIHRTSGMSIPTRYPSALSGEPIDLRKASVRRSLELAAEVIEWCRQSCSPEAF